MPEPRKKEKRELMQDRNEALRAWFMNTIGNPRWI